MSIRCSFLGFVAFGLVISCESACGQDPCAPGQPLLHLDAPGALDGSLAATVHPGDELEVTARLRADGIQAFSISVANDPSVLEILSATQNGSDAARILPEGFHRTDLVNNATGTGFVSVFVLSFCCPENMPPAGDFSLTFARYRVRDARVSDGGTFESLFEVRTAIGYRDGLRGAGQPVQNLLTHQGSTVLPCTQALELALRITPPDFLRGDANFDGVLDISDPVTVLGALFYGDAEIHCDDAADANDDGQINISDAIRIFGWLYSSGVAPSPPFSEPGQDPTPDRLVCKG